MKGIGTQNKAAIIPYYECVVVGGVDLALELVPRLHGDGDAPAPRRVAQLVVRVRLEVVRVRVGVGVVVVTHG